MKKNLVIVIGCCCFLISSCSSFIPGIIQTRDQKNLSVKVTEAETLEGKTVENNLKIKNIGKLPPFHVLSIAKLEFPNNEPIFLIKVLYQGSSWKFYNTIDLKIDNKLYHLEDTKPKHEVVFGDHVAELIKVIIPANILDEMISGEKINIGIGYTLFNLTTEEIASIKTFISN